MKSYPALLAAFYGQDLALTPEKAASIDALMQVKASGGSVSADDIAAACEGRREAATELVAESGAASTYQGPPSGSEARYVAVVPLFGVMMQHGGMMTKMSGGTSTESLISQLGELEAAAAVRTIVLHAHSPGGQVWGTRELAAAIRDIGKRGKTRIVTAGNSQVASACLWAGAAAQEVYLTPGGEIGSLGVLRVHQDVSGAEEAMGVKTTLVAVPERKVEGHEHAALPDETRDRWLAEIGDTYQEFLHSVASYRGVTDKQAADRFGGGGMLTAKQAKEAGLIDGVRSFRDVVRAEVARIQPRGKSRSSNRNRVALAKLY